MKSDNSNELLELSGALKQGYSTLIANAGKVVAVITLAVAILVTFTDMAFSDLSSESFTTTLAVMLMSSYLMYFSLEDTGEREGEKTDEYMAANERYMSARKKITPECIDSLRAFCLDYSTRELEYRRQTYLSERGYSVSDYAYYKGGRPFPRRARIAFLRAEKMKAVKLTPTVLLSRSHGAIKSELCDPTRKKISAGLASLIPSTLCMIFTVSVILTTKDGLTASTVIAGILKLTALPIVGFKGAMDGYRFAKDDKSLWLETKARLLETFTQMQV